MLLRWAQRAESHEPLDVLRDHRPAQLTRQPSAGRPFLPTSACPSSPGSGPDGFRVYPAPSALWFPGAATTQAPGISIGPQSAHLSPVAPRIHSRTSNGSRWLWAGALGTLGAKGALCLLAILPAFTLSLPKNDGGWGAGS